MQASTRKLAIIFGVSLLLLAGPLNAQSRADTNTPKFLKVSPANGTAVPATQVTITGEIEAASPVEIAAGDIKTKTDSKGFFTLTVPLKIGKNAITLVATDQDGDSEEFELELIGKNVVPPIAPSVFAIKPLTRLSYQVIEGRSEPESRVIISGGAKPAIADAAYSTGLFTAFIRLQEGINQLTIVALNEAGASVPVRISIERTAATTQPSIGQAAQINISSGAAQQALPGEEFPRPLVALVTDVRGLPVEGIEVDFTVRFGEARLAGRLERQIVRTDSQGLASLSLRAGRAIGINLVRADFSGNTSSPASFDLETIEPRGDKQTSVSGMLLDVFSHPIEGATIHLGKSTATTGHDGRFVMQKVTPGLDQRLEVFGEEIKSSQYLFWSDASCPIDVLAGADNSLGRPLFVWPLNEGIPLSAGEPLRLNSNGEVTSKGAVLAWQDDYGHEVVPEITLLHGLRITSAKSDGLEGLTFSATQVRTERVPVTLDDGLATGHYYFVAPTSLSFDPALSFKFPNTDKLPPSSRVLIMRYNSTAGHWVKEGTAHVSDDALTIVNDEGHGIRGGGWYAFPSERTQPELTNVNYVQIEGNPELEDKDLSLQAYSDGKRAVMQSGWGEGYFKRLHFRVTHPVLNGEVILGSKGMEPVDPSKEVMVTVTPGGQAMRPGERIILLGRGRPYPGGYYVWSSDDPSIASVVPFLSDGGIESPNRANVIAHKRGRVKIRLMYVTLSGATSVATAEIISH
jgi:hypothetical protein